MGFLVPAAVVAAFVALVLLGRGYTLGARQLRLVSGVASVALLVIGAVLCLTGKLYFGLAFAVLGGLMALSARIAPSIQPPSRSASFEMSESEARSLLGVSDAATRTEIEAAYLRVMKRAHPDQGGTSGLAAKVNAARERLLKKR